jgi:hypothetical protein
MNAVSVRFDLERRLTRLALLLAFLLVTAAPEAEAVNPMQASMDSDDGSSLSLVFFDDFSTDPNINGKWTIHRYREKRGDTEAFWDATSQTMHLTKAFQYRAAAMFANYDLTATQWKASFRFKIGGFGGVNGGGDGLVFMFYKDKDAYGQPAYGTDMGFAIIDGGTIKGVDGYGLDFDNYFSVCDPTSVSYVGVVQDEICRSLAFAEDSRVGDKAWHTVDVRFKNGSLRVAIDGDTVLSYNIPRIDYTFAGIGFGAGTGAAFEDNEIDDLQLWVLDQAN